MPVNGVLLWESRSKGYKIFLFKMRLPGECNQEGMNILSRFQKMEGVGCSSGPIRSAFINYCGSLSMGRGRGGSTRGSGLSGSKG